MTISESTTSSPQLEGLRGEEMRTPDEVAAMLRLSALGWGTQRIAAEFGCSRNTVKRYVAAQGWSAYRRSRRAGKLRSEEHTSELQSLMRTSYAVFCLTKKK